jgi:hypothetical protein
MEKNSTTIVILLMVIIGLVIGAFALGWFNIDKLKNIKTDDKKDGSNDKDMRPLVANLPDGEVSCKSSEVRAYRWKIDPEELVTILEVGQSWTESSKTAAIQYFKSVIDREVTFHQETIRWEKLTNDDIEFVTPLGQLNTTIRELLFKYEIQHDRTCLDSYRKLNNGSSGSYGNGGRWIPSPANPNNRPQTPTPPTPRPRGPVAPPTDDNPPTGHF